MQHAPRKIYMLFKLEPSVELSGGPWYTDKELDTEFIKLWTDVCLKINRDRSIPKADNGDNGTVRQLYPVSHAPYPNAARILLSSTFSGCIPEYVALQLGCIGRVTSTERPGYICSLEKGVVALGSSSYDSAFLVEPTEQEPCHQDSAHGEHVEMLLQVLILDGKVEKLPTFSATSFDTVQDSEKFNDFDENSQLRARRLQRASGKRKRNDASTDGSDQDDQHRRLHDHRTSGSSSRRGHKRRRSHRDSTDSNDDTTTDEDDKRHRKRSRRRGSSREHRKKGKGRRRGGSPVSSSESESGREASSSPDDSSRSRDLDSDNEAHMSRGETNERRQPQEVQMLITSMPTSLDSGDTMGGSVYRAVHEERIRGLGLDQAPCVRCPTFEFCKPAGPVNPQECRYHHGWLSPGEATY